ncbi:MAG TPA: hypothetical protein VHC20_06800 [Candidatus Paceibacterota bacterium]|nr:hypothetical protein [Candidatus Paceibacterota bacterium]
MKDERLVPENRRRIACGDFEAVFAHGGCFIFALRLHERYEYGLRGFRPSGDEPWTHVWARREERCVDIRGVYPEEFISRLAYGGRETPPIRDVSPAEVKAAIEKKAYPAEFLAELVSLADHIVDTHERFQGVKPPNPEAYAEFVAALGKKG